MQLQSIDKARYRKHLNRVIAISILAFAGLSLGIAQFVIWQFTDGRGSHFNINLMGVIFAMLMVGLVLNKLKHHSFMTEIYYVWQLKQQLNQIIRRSLKLNQAVERNDPIAIQIMDYFYRASRQLYELDDNTITLEEHSTKALKIKNQMASLNIASIDSPDPENLSRY